MGTTAHKKARHMHKQSDSGTTSRRLTKQQDLGCRCPEQNGEQKQNTRHMMDNRTIGMVQGQEP